VVVKKPDGSNRICVDFRKLNKVTIFDPEPMPQMQDIFAELSGSRYFSKFDFRKGYVLASSNVWEGQKPHNICHAQGIVPLHRHAVWLGERPCNI